MRISDWSSDVCSSDLPVALVQVEPVDADDVGEEAFSGFDNPVEEARRIDDARRIAFAPFDGAADGIGNRQRGHAGFYRGRPGKKEGAHKNGAPCGAPGGDRKSTRLNSSH